MVNLVQVHLSDGSMLATVLDTMKSFAKHVQFEFTKAGLAVRSSDEENNVKVFFKLKADFMSPGYMCSRDTYFSINLSVILKYIKLAKKQGGYDIICKEEPVRNSVQPNYIMQLQFSSEYGNERIFTFNCYNNSPGKDQIVENIPRSICDVKMPSNLFLSKVRKLLSKEGNMVFRTILKKRVWIFGMAEDGARDGIIPVVDKVNDCEVSTDDYFKYKYPSRFLKEFIKGSPLSKTVYLQFQKYGYNDDPYRVMSLEYTIRSPTNKNQGYLRFYLRNKLD